MTIEEKRRELFEQEVQLPDTVKWCSIQSKYTGENFWLADYAFGAFNAALDAVVILLPSPYPSVFYGAEEFADGIERCREFIKENNPLGLKVKP